MYEGKPPPTIFTIVFASYFLQSVLCESNINVNCPLNEATVRIGPLRINTILSGPILIFISPKISPHELETRHNELETPGRVSPHHKSLDVNVQQEQTRMNPRSGGWSIWPAKGTYDSVNRPSSPLSSDSALNPPGIVRRNFTDYAFEALCAILFLHTKSRIKLKMSYRRVN